MKTGWGASSLQGTEERAIQELAAISLLAFVALSDHEVIDLSYGDLNGR
jgi:hypothetical protein